MAVRRAALVGLMLLVLVGPASAQEPPKRPVELVVGPIFGLGDEGLLAPDTEQAQATFTTRVGCSSTEAAITSIVVRYAVVDAPAFASATITPAAHTFRIDPARCTDTAFRHAVKSDLTFVVSRDAPALREVSVKVAATVEESHAQGGTTKLGPFHAYANATVDYLPLVNLVPEIYFRKVAPGATVEFPVQVKNLGNGETQTSYRVALLGENLLANLSAPPPSTLESRAQRGPGARDTQDVVFVAVTPMGDLYTNSIFSFQVTATSRSVDDRGAATDETQMAFSIQAEGAGGPAPGLPLAAVLLVALAVVAARRKR